jgi:hypothetical protein
MKLVGEGSETAQWYQLVNEVQVKLGIQLPEDVESYLVFLLMRFRSRPDMASRVLALDYLRGLQSAGALRNDRLQEVGDHCLLFSGLFPRRARRLNVSSDYFIAVGCGAYRTLGDLCGGSLAAMFTDLGHQFRLLTRMLRTMRGLAVPQAVPVTINDGTVVSPDRRFH